MITTTVTADVRHPRWDVRSWIRAVRPHQWIKNVTVLAAPAAASVLTHVDVIVRTAAGVGVFIVASAGTYLLNDARDAAADRLHPEKRYRPIASGNISPRAAYVAGLAACAGAAAIAFVLRPEFGLVVSLYVVMTFLYSWKLKNVPVLELMLIAVGFLLRAVGGGVVNHVPLSRWFMLVAAAGALFIVTGKRLAERQALGEGAAVHRAVIGEYSADWLRQTSTIALTATLMGYCLWAFQYLGRDILQVLLAISVAPFTAALLRYTQLLSQGHGEHPERDLARDPFLVVAILTCVVLLFIGLYVA